jgi:nickel/cobalt transporter (NicO) family protein
MQCGCADSCVALRIAGVLLLFAHFLFPSSTACGHPIPRENHDRTIIVRLGGEPPIGQVEVTVEYRLEVDELTVVTQDLQALADKFELGKIHTKDELYDGFTRGYAPILAANLLAKVDGQALQFACVKSSHTLQDEAGAPLNHLRCDFVFQAKVRPRSSSQHQFSFRESNYELEVGLIRLSLLCGRPVHVVSKTEPDAALQARQATELRPGDDSRLRTLQATFTLASDSAASSASGEPRNPDMQKRAEQPSKEKGWWQRLRELSLLDLFLDTRYGFWMLIALAAAVGGIHALTPGHGKTLVAAYLVGERGTVGHALLLGLVTTLTHTGVVIAVAIALRLLVPQGRLSASGQQHLQTALELGGGLLVVGLGFWLLLRRLTGQADHFHLGGHGHHHHGNDHHHHGHASHSHDPGHADHYHDEHGHVHVLVPPGQSVSWWGLIILGINGGIVPCWDAIVVLLLAVSTNRLTLALPMLLAFSAGLAAVLILFGVLVVRTKSLASPRWGGSRLFKALPVLSALVVTVLGLWLCYDSFRPHAAPAIEAVRMQ